jgi:hypothetical protein
MTPTTIISDYATVGRAYRRWYVHARLIVGKLAVATTSDLGRAADILALLSPRVTVSRNLRLAYAYLTEQSLATVLPNIIIALQHYETTGEIRGPKTKRFALALRGADNVVVVDTHLAAAFGYRATDARLIRVQKAIEGVIGRIASRRHWAWTETQAAVWAGYYRVTYLRGTVPKYDVGDLTSAPF